jgi:hypothetical protein
MPPHLGPPPQPQQQLPPQFPPVFHPQMAQTPPFLTARGGAVPLGPPPQFQPPPHVPGSFAPNVVAGMIPPPNPALAPLLANPPILPNLLPSNPLVRPPVLPSISNPVRAIPEAEVHSEDSEEENSTCVRKIDEREYLAMQQEQQKLQEQYHLQQQREFHQQQAELRKQQQIQQQNLLHNQQQFQQQFAHLPTEERVNIFKVCFW